ncbi:MAG: helix-turn-helix domain-containing protein [bacterium]
MSLHTANQRNTLCSACPIARAADLIGDSWSLLIVRDLLEGSRRFNDLATSLSGISTRTLTKKLQLLEANRIVSREQFSEKPPRVEYSLTTKGRAFKTIITNMRKFGERYPD